LRIPPVQRNRNTVLVCSEQYFDELIATEGGGRGVLFVHGGG
jgi:hypothetical protein